MADISHPWPDDVPTANDYRTAAMACRDAHQGHQMLAIAEYLVAELGWPDPVIPWDEVAKLLDAKADEIDPSKEGA